MDEWIDCDGFLSTSSTFGFRFSVFCFWGKKGRIGKRKMGVGNVGDVGNLWIYGHGFVSWVRGVFGYGMVWFGFLVRHLLR